MSDEVAVEENNHEWSAFYDDEGRIYYFNSVTQESSWDAPEKYNPPPEQPAEAAVEATETAADESNDSVKAWVAYQDDEGRTYYFNTVTEETTWDKPEGYEPPLAEEVVQPVSPVREESPGADEREDSPVQPIPMEEDEAQPEQKSEVENEVEEEHEHEQVDPAVKRLEEARTALQQTDAIMEPGVLAHVTEVVTADGGKPQAAIEALSESYFGQTSACGLMARWLADLKSQAPGPAKHESEDTKAFSSVADDIRDMVQDVLNKIAKERFTKKGGDSILKLAKSEAAFLGQMMVSSRWRKLLIDLSASNKDSALLMYCLEQISKKGHHREIARRINQSDHFTVFNAMLASELSVIGKIAVSSCKSFDTSISLEDLVSDLQRTCTSTAYTYIFAIEVLRQLVFTAKQKILTNAELQNPVFLRAIRKWERLNEELQSTVVDPSTAAGSTPLFRKRRLDVASTISELHQRQRRRLLPSSEDEPVEDVASNDTRAKTESAILEFLRRYSLGTRIDDLVLDKMLPVGLSGDSSNLVGRLLIKRPLTVKALMGYIFKPAGQRASAATVRNKCARLIALAVDAAEKEALSEAEQIEDTSLTVEHDEIALTRMLVEGSRLCEALENMVSFIVSEESEGNAESPGQQLVSLAMKCAPVAQGVAIWALQVTKGSEFVQSASYPTLSPSILSLMRVLFMNHPFTRNEALEVAASFLQHSNSDISYQTMNEIKEQSLRLLLFLCTKGEAPAVLDEMTKLLQGSAPVDASLIRYFIAGLSEFARAPFSIPFSRLLSRLLMVPSTIEAVKTSYFDDDSKKQLEHILRYLKDLDSNGVQGKLSRDDADLFETVTATYLSI